VWFQALYQTGLNSKTLLLTKFDFAIIWWKYQMKSVFIWCHRSGWAESDLYLKLSDCRTQRPKYSHIFLLAEAREYSVDSNWWCTLSHRVFEIKEHLANLLTWLQPDLSKYRRHKSHSKKQWSLDSDYLRRQAALSQNCLIFVRSMARSWIHNR